ncbi:Hormone-sensitive lipase [Trichinella nelsoni]|uniref:Hormone-sensitive lipase n=1 Tax=Trichinella nelsoni TaxID=6336 RepID=A0A0V0SGV0_9BILA|nr:Hormone-sensitive lipase [Trichinella nelsoni]
MAREYPCKKTIKPILMLMWNKIPAVQNSIDIVALETMAAIANAIFVSRRFKSIRVMNIWYVALKFRPGLPIYHMNAMLKTSCLNSNKYPFNKGERESLGKLVYSSGSMRNLIRGVKLFSLLTTTVAFGMQPMIWHDMFVHDDRSALLTTLTLSFLSFSVMCSPLLLNLLTKRYVICMYHDEKQQLFSVMTYNIFAWPRIIQFKFEDIKAFESPILANLLVNSYPLLMISTNFTDQYVLEKFLPLLGEEEETPKRKALSFMKTMKANVGVWNSKKFSVSRDSVCSLIEKLFYEFPVHLRSYSIEGVSFEKHICAAMNSLQEVKSSLHPICMAMSRFDYDISIVGNGYRSIVTVFDLCLIGLLRSLFKISKISHRRWFRASRPVKEVVAYAEILRVLCQAVDLVSKYLPKPNSHCLFLTNVDADDLDRLMSSFEQLDQSNFYGRQIGFQFCSSVSNVFHVIGTALASYSTLWNHSNVWYRRYPSIVYSCCRFLVNPENRSKHIAKIFRHSDLELCRSFWSLLESPILRTLPSVVGPKLAVNELYCIQPTDMLSLEKKNGTMVNIPVPSAFSGPRNLCVRILSLHRWPGLMGEKRKDRSSRSNFLVLHCHGGGFIATSTKTHETYLKFWAAELNCPIVSVDYSLAPENPYPRALEEALYAYAWCLTHADFLGWTGEYLCFAGESAGGLLLTSTCLKLIQLDVARLPDKLVTIYTPFLVEFAPSASRLLSLLDPLIPWGIMYRCLYAYKFGALTDDQRLAEVREGRKLSKSGIEIKISSEECLGEEKILPDREIETHMSDSKYIRLSTELFDREFIKFLSMHELTEPSFHCSPESRLGKSGEIQRDQIEEPNLSKSRCGSVTDNLVEVCSTVSDMFVENVSRILKDTTNVSSAVDCSSSSNGNDPVSNRKRLQTSSTNDSGSGIFADGDPLLSPWLATDELLRNLPPTSVVACHLDPLLDDSISFCKKLRRANVPHTLDLIESLPHGFMNLMSFSKECRLATQLCLRRIKETHFKIDL